jgi:vitamin B12 transporter
MDTPRLRLYRVVFPLVFVVSLWAQSQNMVTGCIEDSTRSVLPNVTVTLIATESNRRMQTQSDEKGCFAFGNVSAGTHHLLILADAFAPYERDVAVTGSVMLDRIVLDVQPIRNSIVVTANRAPTPSMTLGASVDVIERTGIEASELRGTADILRNIAGLTVLRTGDIGGITSLFMRGGESDYTKVLIDGIPVNQPGGLYDFSHLVTDNVSRIEVVRGPQSAVFGSDAITGVVQIFTQTASGSPEFEYSSEGGSFSTYDQRAALRGSWRKFDFSNTFSRYDTDNIGRNNDYRNASYFGNFGFTPKAGQSLRATLLDSSVKAGAPGANAPGFISFGPNNRMSRLERAGGLTYRALIGPRVTQHVAYRLYDHDQYFYSAFGTSPVLHTRHRLEYHGDVALASAGTFSYGVDYDRENATVASRRRFRNDYGYYVQQQLRLLGRLDITAGVRVEDNTTFGTSGNPRLALSFRALPATRLRFNAGTGIKEPNFIENFSENRFFLGNPDLLAEKSRSWEAGVEQSFWGDRITADLDWFDNRFRNLIELVPQPDGSSRYQNIGRTTARGAELRLRTHFRQVSGQLNYTYLDGHIQESAQRSFPYRPGDPLLRRPRHSADLTLVWKQRRWIAYWSTRYIGRRADSDFFTHSTPLFSNASYSASNTAFTYDFNRHVSFFVRLENVFDRSYQEVLGYLALGRSVSGGAKVRIGAER